MKRRSSFIVFFSIDFIYCTFRSDWELFCFLKVERLGVKKSEGSFLDVISLVEAELLLS